MASDEATCPLCGAPLVGKDRFEGKCAACREKEVLGEAPPRQDDEPEAPEGMECPACGAVNPPDRRTCSECQGRLGPARVSAGKIALLCAAGALVVAAVVVVVQVWGGGGPTRRERPAPQAPTSQQVARTFPPIAAAPATAGPSSLKESVRRETHKLLALLRAEKYEEILDNYCQPDEADLPRVERLLDEIIRGTAADGFRRWSALLSREGKARAMGLLRQAGDPYPAYTADLLAHLTRDPQASGRSVAAGDRARNVVEWHLRGLFEGLDLASARIIDIRSVPGGALTAEVSYRGSTTALRPGDNPGLIRWRPLPPVALVIKLALAHRLEKVAEILGKPIPPRPTPAP